MSPEWLNFDQKPAEKESITAFIKARGPNSGRIPISI
jgi:hypothetical protein